MRVFVDQLAVYFTFTNSINTQIFITPGQQRESTADDKRGYISATIRNITVTSQSQTTISNIQSMPGWQSCPALFPPGSGRDGQICAAGLGTAQSTMTPDQFSPSMDSQSAKFTMGGPTVAQAGLESTRGREFERLICEVYYGKSASSALV